jgi:hypothetical protein
MDKNEMMDAFIEDINSKNIRGLNGKLIIARPKYYFKDKPYAIICESKMKISELWIDVVIYETLYDNPEGRVWVREKGQFYKLFERK